ncbi:MAG: dienelactone hydrolase family protein, partial [Phycisphaerales bacterium]|nr:dienelactone hydrolase family protein [Phycisphaerales bacterium]
GHGFLTNPVAYDSTLRHLATHGYLVIATESYTGFFPNHSKYADDLLHSLTWLERADTDSGSPYFGAVDTGALGLSGHSMGGGASVLAASRDPRVRALVNLAAAETNPSAIGAMGAVLVPAVLLSGSEDTITPPSQHQVPMYEAGAAPKQLVTLVGGSHCGFLDDSIIFCDPGSMDRAVQLRLTRRLLVERFDLYLKGDQARWGVVWGPGRDDDPQVHVTSESGISLSPSSERLPVRAGARALSGFDVTNTGSVECSYTLAVEHAPWPSSVTPAQTSPLAPGGSASIEVLVSPPVDAAGGQAELLVTARSDRDTGTRGYATLEVDVLCPGDWTLDGEVDTRDLLAFLNDWAGVDPESDLNRDGVVDTLDVLVFLNLYALDC